MVEKLIQNGKVAVIYSPGYGAGWSTWADKDLREILMFDADIALSVLCGDNDKALRIATEKCRLRDEYFYDGGSDKLKIAWVLTGCCFQIREYDGSEYVSVRDEMDWFVA